MGANRIGVVVSKTAWLIEWPHDHGDDGGTRWWHPDTGWRFNVHKGIRFSREEDAEAYIRSQKFCQGVVAVEHQWVDGLQTPTHTRAALVEVVEKADGLMMAVRNLKRELFSFAEVLQDARPVEHAWVDAK